MNFCICGGNEQSTHKYVSELLGKETIDTNTYGKSTGGHGSYSTNYQNTGRELMTPDEVRMLDNKYALLFIRGERPIQDLKYDVLKHNNVKLTVDGKVKEYLHGTANKVVATVYLEKPIRKLKDVNDKTNKEYDEKLKEYEMLSNEELEKNFKIGD